MEQCAARGGWTDYARREYLLVGPALLNRNVSEAPLGRRAWVPQELVLALRALHVVGEQLL